MLIPNNISICTLISSARSPLYSHISAAIQGLSSIRAYHEDNRILNQFHFYQNEHTKAWYMKIITSRWFGMRIDLIGSSFLTIVAFSSIPLADSKYPLYTATLYGIQLTLALDLDPALVGLSMAYAITLIGMLQHCIRTSAEIENLVRIYSHLARGLCILTACYKKSFKYFYLDGIGGENDWIW